MAVVRTRSSPVRFATRGALGNDYLHRQDLFLGPRCGRTRGWRQLFTSTLMEHQTHRVWTAERPYVRSDTEEFI